MSKEKFNSLDRLKLSEQALGCLKNAGINDLDRLSDIDIDLEKLNKICFMKQNIVNEIVEKAGKIGIKFAPIVEIKDEKEYFIENYEEEEDFIENYGDIDIDEKIVSGFSFNVVSDTYLIQEHTDGKIKTYLLDNFLDDEGFLSDALEEVDGFVTNDYTSYDIFKKYVKEFKIAEHIPKEIIIKKKIAETLDIYEPKVDKFKYDFITDMCSKLEKNLYNNLDKIEEEFFDVQVERYGEKQYEFKELLKEEMAPLVLFVKSKLKKLRANKNQTNVDKENLNTYEKLFQELKKVPRHFIEVLEPDRDDSFRNDFIKRDISNFSGDNYDLMRELVEKKYEEAEKTFEGCNYKEIFNFIPKNYLQEEFYGKYNPMEEIKLEKIPFISNFVRICKELSPKQKNAYNSKEILQFLINKLKKNNQVFIDSFIDNMEENTSYYDTYTEGTGRRGR